MLLIHLQGVATASGFPTAEIDEYLLKESRRFNIPQISTAIVDSGGILYESQIGALLPENANFYVGSISKSFTALAILSLVEEGKVSLSDDFREHLPEIDVAGSAVPITLEDLLSHQSGLPKKSGATLNFPSLKELRENPVTLTVESEPGTEFGYSSLGYVLLGQVIEAVSGMSYSEFVKTRFLKPLGMENTFCNVAEGVDRTAPHFRYVFAFPVESRQTEFAPTRMPAGLIRSTAKDLAAILKELMKSGGSTDEPSGITEKTVSFVRTPLVGNTNFGYGYGFGFKKIDGESIILHEGLTPVSYSLFGFLPERKLGFVVLMNIPLHDFLAGTDPGENIYRNVVRIALGKPPVPIKPYLLWIRWTLFLAVILSSSLLIKTLIQWGRQGFPTQPIHRCQLATLILEYVIVPVAIFGIAYSLFSDFFNAGFHHSPDLLFTGLFLAVIHSLGKLLDRIKSTDTN